MDLINKDLNLLVVFSVIAEERSLSRAAARLFVSQSAVSHALKRLRAEFGDPLFVRESKGVTPTDFALALAPKVRRQLQAVEAIYHSGEAFDPKTAKRTLVLSAGDYFSISGLERFVTRLAKEAPLVRLVIQPVANVFQLEKFASGEIHLAITAISVEGKEGFHFREIYQDKISFCARKGHPFVKGEPTPEKYLALEHINVSNYGSDRGVVDEYLETIGKKRAVKLVAGSFYDAARLVRSTDLVLSAPHEICRGLAADYDLKVYPLPFKYRPRSISMIWHERTDQDAFHKWVRDLIVRP